MYLFILRCSVSFYTHISALAFRQPATPPSISLSITDWNEIVNPTINSPALTFNEEHPHGEGEEGLRPPTIESTNPRRPRGMTHRLKFFHSSSLRFLFILV